VNHAGASRTNSTAGSQPGRPTCPSLARRRSILRFVVEQSASVDDDDDQSRCIDVGSCREYLGLECSGSLVATVKWSSAAVGRPSADQLARVQPPFAIVRVAVLAVDRLDRDQVGETVWLPLADVDRDPDNKRLLRPVRREGRDRSAVLLRGCVSG
jgi:hypothetical protein